MLRGSVPSATGGAQHTFSRAPQAHIPRSSFNRTHGCKTTFNEGILTPIFADEMLPGDTFNLKLHGFARLATPIFPIMDNLYLESFFFAVPYRLVWDNWQRFNGEQKNPGDSTDFLIPTVTMNASTGAPEGSIYDYFGIPTKVPSLQINSLHLRAYNLIYNEWFRDENLQDSVPVPLGDGPDDPDDFTVLRRGKRYDYFTSCLPWPQKGEAVSLPLGLSAPVLPMQDFSGELSPTFQTTSDPTPRTIIATTNVDLGMYTRVSGSSVTGALRWQDPNLYADLTAATAATINDLRLAFQTQKLLERDARGGTRYTELIKSHFQITSPDYRLQRPEYLGGGSTPVIVNPVAQTAQSSDPSTRDVLGNLGAYGVCAVSHHGFTYSATEHCLLIGLVCVRADLNYQTGLERMWSRRTRLDYYWPALSHIGEQAVLNKEIYAQGPAVLTPAGTPVDDDVFGYQERYAEYRYKPSTITGLFRSNAANSLDAWHLAQDFASLPALNEEFIIEDAPMSRVKAVATEPDFIFDSVMQYRCARPMPTYSVPGYIDHF